MKKLHIILTLAVAFVFASCSKDYVSEQSDSNVTTITVGLTGDAALTRSDASEPNMRLFLMLSSNDVIVDKYVTDSWGGENIEWDINLVAGINDYVISAWADFGSDYYNVTETIGGAPAVAMTNITSGNDAQRDAFFAIEEIENTTEGRNVAITLKRPFAQVKIISSDCLLDAVYNAGFVPTDYTLSFNAATSLNLLSGELGEKETITIENSTNLVYNEKPSNEGVLSFDYIFAEDEASVNTLSAAYFKVDESELCSYDFSNIPLRRNYITTITGNLLTSGGSIEVTVDSEWEKEHITENIKLIELTSGTNDIIITAADLESYSNSDPVSLIYIITGGGEGSTINISFENETVAAAAGILLDFTGCDEGTNVVFTGGEYTGTLTFGQYYDAADTAVLGDVNFYAPYGSGVLSSGYTISGTLTVASAPNTFTVETGATVVGDIFANGGRLVLDGDTEGTIYVDNASVYIAKGDAYDVYDYTCVNNLYYTDVVGFDFTIASLLEEFEVSSLGITDYINLGIKLQYAGVVGVFDFNNSGDNGGFNALNWRNIALSLTNNDNVVSVATLKEAISSDISADTMAEYLNEVIAGYAAQLVEKAEGLDEKVAELESSVPTAVYEKFSSLVAELQLTVNTFVETIPEVTLPSIGTPIGTITPDADNFKIDDIAAFIGTPEDEFSLSDISSYLDGSKSITLYMIVNLANSITDAEEDVTALLEEIAVYEARAEILTSEIAALYAEHDEIAATDEDLAELEKQFNEAVKYYNSLEEPATSGGTLFSSWYITTASINSDFTLVGSESYYDYKYIYIGLSSSIDDTNKALYTAKNAQLDVITGIVSEYRAKLATLSESVYEEIETKEAELEEIGTQTDLSDYSWLTDLNSATIVNTLLSLLGSDVELTDEQLEQLDITDYLYSGELGTLYLDLYQAQVTYLAFGTITDELGVTDDMLNVIVGLGDYLEEVSDVVTELNTIGESISDANPWEYSYPNSLLLADGVNGASVTLEFEYATGKTIYVTNSASSLIEE